MNNLSFFKSLVIILIALVIWIPLKPYGVTDLSTLGLFNLNWIAAFMGLGAVFLVNDFNNFQEKTKTKHFIIAALLCPVWPIARFGIFQKNHRGI